MGVKVRERKGAWWLFIDHRGKRVARRVGVGKAGKKAADEAAVQIAAKLASGDRTPLATPTALTAAVPTFKAYAEQWLAGPANQGVKPITADRYRSITTQHLLPAFGELPLTEITRARIRSRLAVWLGPTGKVRGSGAMRRSSVRLIVATLRVILNAAVEDGLLTMNPALRLGRLLRPADPSGFEQERPDPFTADEIEKLLTTAEREIPEWYSLVLTLARTGLRIGEALGLQWADVGPDRLMVRRTHTRGRIGTPKGNRGRLVDLSPRAAEALQARRSLLEAEAAIAGRPLAPWIFPDPTGKPTDDRWLRDRVWEPLLRRAGVRHRGIHQLRHSYASVLLGRGVPPKYVQGQLGHASLAITLSVYSHLLPGEYGRLADQLDALGDATARNLSATEEGSPRKEY
jgi:integrase